MNIAKMIIEKLLQEGEHRKNSFEKEISRSVNSNLYIRKRKNSVHFAEYHDGKQSTLKKDDDRIYEIARYQYIKRLLTMNSKMIDVLRDTKRRMDAIDDGALKQFMEKCSVLDLQRVRMSDKELEWCREYESNPYHPETLKYETLNGVKMRSKSERLIGNKLEEYNIPYRYEPKLIINGKTYYPDFMILCPNGEVIIWEHLGLMDDENYRMKAFVKMTQYRKAGYIQYRNLICTWEEDLESMSVVDEIICRFILKIPV